MAKKKQKAAPYLSPENYIRQKSRNLPLGECFISRGWEESYMSEIIITRKHVNGNVTACLYLVDLACLGIKDTTYMFNVSFGEVEAIKKELEENGAGVISVPYELVHNVIYASLEFAEDYGFKPCKDFTSTTRYFLEEDTDDIPLMEIKCGGEDGKPLYVNTGFDSPARARQILDQLEKTAGKGNYHYLLKADGDEEFYEEDDEIDEDEEEDEIVTEIKQLTQDEQKKLFFKLLSLSSDAEQPPSKDDIRRLSILSNILIEDMVSNEAVEKQFNVLVKKMRHKVVDEYELPNSLFPDEQNIEPQTVDLFLDVLDDIENDKKPKKAVAIFQKETRETPISDFLEIFYLSRKRSRKFNEKLNESYQKYPHYFLIKLFHQINKDKTLLVDTGILEKLLSDEKLPITQFEAEFFFSAYTFHLAMNEHTDLAALIAFEKYIFTLDFLPEECWVEMFSMIEVTKIARVVKHFRETGELDAIMNSISK